MPTFFFILPYPPSVNTYWGFQGHRRFLTVKAVAFKAAVAVAVAGARLGTARLEVRVMAHAPDKRTRDLDNILKPLGDALMQAGLFNDDSQIDRLIVERGEVVKGGRADVWVTAM